jgi:hypothetical protein
MSEGRVETSRRQALFQQASDPEYWKQLNPSLNISKPGEFLALERLPIDESVIEQAKKSLRSEGYFVIDELFDKSLMERLAKGVKAVWDAGWPEPFVVVYDEYWQLFRSLEPLYTAILGPNYKQVPNYWCWYVDKANTSAGWGLHRDRPAVNTVLEDGMSTTITTWIPLSDATVLNGCIYVLPAHLDVNYPRNSKNFNLKSFDLPDLQSLRALPAKEGSVLCWTEALLHMGSRSSDRATGPRISISYTYQRGDVHAYESPTLNPFTLPTFQERIGLIGQTIVNYKVQGRVSNDMVSIAAKLGVNMPPIIVEDGYIHQVVESDVPLSKSVLWPLQREYFSQKSMSAWEEVPLYSTSRTPFCETYAEMLLALLLDYKDQIKYDQPLFILELGGGTGCFAYRFLNELLEKIKSFKSLERLKIRYVLTDFTDRIVWRWLDNKKFERLRKADVIDFAVFNPLQDKEMQLLDTGKRLSSKDFANPLIVIGNYLFDSIEQDAFRIEQGSLKETKFTIYRSERTAPVDAPVSIEQLKLLERHFDVQGNYYGDPSLDSILEHYRSNLEEASVIFPIGAFRVLENLLELSNGELALLASDKGFNSLDSRQIRGLWPQQYTLHGSFSFDVNFDAIARYVESRGGLALTEAGDHSGLCTMAGMFSGQQGLACENLKHYFRSNLANKDLINSLFNVEGLICNATFPETVERTWTELFMSIIQTYNFEPVVFTIAFHRMFEKMESELDRLDKQQTREILEALNKVSKNIFAYDTKHNALDALMRFYVRMDFFNECIELCKESIECFGRIGQFVDHLAVCYESTGQLELAHRHFAEALSLNPEHQWAQAGVERTKSHALKV